VKARLIVNRGSGEQPHPTEKPLRGELFTVQPTDPATIQAGGGPLDVLAFDRAILGRLQPRGSRRIRRRP
jgi:hypothetical protein